MPKKLYPFQIERYRKRVLAAANRMGFGEFAEDLAQDAVVLLLENKRQSSSINQIIVDLYRKRRSGCLRETPTETLEKTIGIIDHQEEKSNIGKIYRYFRGTDRTVLIMKNEFGLYSNEIAYCLDLSERRVKDILNRMAEVIQEKGWL